ncbi:MAG: sigma-54 dependent transcriptional regulator [Myxococcota bacterium]
MATARILIVDDEKNILATLSRALRVEDFDVDVAGSSKLALSRLSQRSYDLILLDVMLPGTDGLSLLRQLRSESNDVAVIVMSGHASIETAVEATRFGAREFIEKPISTDRLLVSIRNCLDIRKLEAENKELKQRSGAVNSLLGESDPMRQLRQRISLAASANAAVLVTGERGTGKELVSRAIHEGSKRAHKSLEKLNCAAVPADLIESELFGHEAGAFTGATRQRLGKFERAHGGTLFLDEVGDMPPSMQAKLLRVLQEGEIERVGGQDTIRVDVRVVAATNKSLEKEIKLGRFRADLFDRLNILPIHVPALRERRSDIATLAEYFVDAVSKANDRPPKTFSSEALDALKEYGFPGNVRELRNLIERLVILIIGSTITESDIHSVIPFGQRSSSISKGFVPGMPLRQMMDGVERDLILQALDYNRGHITNTAASLGLERSHLYKKMKALGIRKEAKMNVAESIDLDDMIDS